MTIFVTGMIVDNVKCLDMGILFSYVMLLFSFLNIIQLEEHLALHVDIVRFLTPNR